MKEHEDFISEILEKENGDIVREEERTYRINFVIMTTDAFYNKLKKDCLKTNVIDHLAHGIGKTPDWFRYTLLKPGLAGELWCDIEINFKERKCEYKFSEIGVSEA